MNQVHVFRRNFVGIVLAVVVLAAGCGGSAAAVSEDTSSQEGGAASSSSTDQGEVENPPSAGGSLFQVDVPIPGEQTFYDVTSPPPHWPAVLGVPDGLDTSQGFFLDQPSPAGRSLSATFVHTEGDPYGTTALEQIVSMGFEFVIDNELGDSGRFSILRRGSEEVQITLGPDSTKIVLAGGR